MCGGGGGGDSPLAKASAQQEQERQARIQQGMQDINTMFEGGRTVSGQVGTGARYDPNATYYNKDGSVWTPGDAAQYRTNNRVMLSGGGWSGAASPENQTYTEPTYAPDSFTSDEDARQGMFNAAQGSGLYTGVQDTEGYSPAFYDKAYQAQLDYALPQVDKQFQQAQRDLTFALARQGLNASSQGSTLQSDLEGRRALAIQGEQDKARQVRNQQVQSVESERDNLTKLLQSTGDVTSTMNAAAARKQVLDAAPAIQEVTPLFQNATGTLADMIVTPALRQAGAAAGNTGGYGSTVRGSGKVVN